MEFKDGYASIRLRGKTGERRIPVLASVPYLQEWLNDHPDKENPNAPLWVKFGQKKAMTYSALAKIIKVATKRAGLKKSISPHTLRHSRATFLATRLTEAQMNQVFGWIQGSDMPSTYVHLSGRDIDDAILGVYGLKKERGKKKPSKLGPKKCLRCGQVNPVTYGFCGKCGMALDMKTIVEMEEKRREADKLMSRLLEDPEVQWLLKHKIKELGLA